MTIYMDSERCAHLNTSGGHKLYKVNSLTIVLVPNCLIKGTLIWYWNMSDITKICICHLNKSSQPCSHICQHGQDGMSVLLLLHIGNATLTLRAIFGSNSVAHFNKILPYFSLNITLRSLYCNFNCSHMLCPSTVVQITQIQLSIHPRWYR